MTSPLPTCFGKRWDASNIRCTGGLDPAYTNQQDGSHKRDRCDWFSQCATRTTASNAGRQTQQQPQQQNNFIPSNNLIRRPQHQPPPNPVRAAQTFLNGAMRGVTRASQPHPAATGNTQVRPPQQPVATPPTHNYYGQPASTMVHPSMASNPWSVPMNHQSPGAQIPGYLTVPEPMMPGQHWSQRLGLSLLRAGLKAMGHTAANFFDHSPFNSWHPPPPQEPPSNT